MKGIASNKMCSVCGKPLDIDTFVPGESTKEPVEVESGDITFCFNCRTVLIINEAFNIVVPDEDELYEIVHDEDFHYFISQIDDARKNKINLN